MTEQRAFTLPARLPAPIVPKEHGAWAVLFVPIIVAALSVRAVSWQLLLMTIAAFLVFISYVPMQTLLRGALGRSAGTEKHRQAKVWGPAYLAGGVLALLPLLAQGFILLLPIGLLGAAAFVGNFFFSRRHPKTIPGDFMAVLGLSLGAPGAYYVLTGRIDSAAFVLWTLNVLFFGSSVFYVHAKLAAASTKKPSLTIGERLTIGSGALVYSIVALVLVELLALNGFVRPALVWAFVPMAGHSLYGILTLMPKVRFKNLGFLLLGHSMVFGILAGWLG